MTDTPLTSESSIADFLNATAAKQPAPGGGAVAALAGALAAAIGEMVLAYSVGKKDLAAHQPELESALGELLRARQLFLGMMVEDQSAFAALTAAKKATPRDETQICEAVEACILTPSIVAETAAAIIELCERLSPIVNRFLLSDLKVCAELSMATLRSAIHNVAVNLPELSSPARRAAISSNLSAVLALAVLRVERFTIAIDAKMSNSK